ncbi:MAG: hypothetical protein HKN24_06110 [Acidimicrobiales bacterium]|nr:hypothetical protein [Acidimicrobiales bacterium]
MEQTRKFRASAEQCIDMLQRGKKAGTVQRKIALDTIVAVRSDARTGRLQIRTLNGTHRLEPVSYDEADVLRQIAIELELRMPRGGAEFTVLEQPRLDRRRTDADEERSALTSLEQARAEDSPDDLGDPEFEAHGRKLAAHEIDLLRTSLVSEIDEAPAAQDLPADITVAGGVEITFEPDPAVDPALAPMIDQAAPIQEPAADVQPADYAVTPAYPDSPPPQERRPEAPPELHGQDPRIDDVMKLRLDRRHQRAIRLQMEEGPAASQEGPVYREPPVDTAAEPTNAPVDDGVPSPLFAAPETLVTEVDETSEPGGDLYRNHDGEIVEGRREVDDPNFPSIFDRRRSTSSVGSHPRFGEDLPVDQALSHHVPAEHTHGDDEGASAEVPAVPPTISAPSGPPAVDMSGTVGFNPDFDVNPFR